MAKNKPIRIALAALLLLSMPPVLAEGGWQHHKTGDGTAFEERWVSTNAIMSMSSNEKLASDMYLSASLYEDGGLYVWVTHISSELCKFSDWKLAVDKTVISIKPKLGEDTKATVLHPVDAAESENLLKLFSVGEKVAVRFHANCDNMFYLNYIGTATMTYSLNGSSAALKFVAEAELQQRIDLAEVLLEVSGEDQASLEAMPAGSMARYQFAIQQKIMRNWVAPASAMSGIECVIDVRQLRGGDVVSATVGRCNGDEAVRRSIEAAVYKASPLPEPLDRSLFQRDLRITFKPEE